MSDNMTKEEAHRILSNGLANAPSEHEWCVAFEMAIKALEKEPCEDEELDFVQPHKKIGVNLMPCEDAISRQAVLDGLASIAKAKAKSNAQKAMMGRTMFFIERLPYVSTGKQNRWDKLYSYLNDMRFGIAPDETTPQDERSERLAQVDIIDSIMEWIEKLPQPYKGESEELNNDKRAER